MKTSWKNKQSMLIKKSIMLFAVVFVSVFSSCKKDAPLAVSKVATDSIAIKHPTSSTQFTYDEIKLIEKYAHADIPTRDSVYAIILSAHNLLSKAVDNTFAPKLKVSDYEEDENAPDASDVFGNVDDMIDVGEDPGIENNAPNEYWVTDDFNSYGNDVQAYHVLITCQFPQSARRKNIVIVNIPIKYDLYGTVSLDGLVNATIIGLSLGNVDASNHPTPNLLSDGNNTHPTITGDANGFMVETRTVIHTSDGKILVKGGLQAAVYNAGAEVSAGITVTSSTNQTANYLYDAFFKVSTRAYPYDYTKPSIKTWGTVDYLGY